MPMISVELICIIAGPLISLAVSAAKRWQPVKRYPKVTAALLSIATALIGEMTIGGMNWAEIAACTIIPFSVAVTSHEMSEDVQGKHNS